MYNIFFHGRISNGEDFLLNIEQRRFLKVKLKLLKNCLIVAWYDYSIRKIWQLSVKNIAFSILFHIIAKYEQKNLQHTFATLSNDK